MELKEENCTICTKVIGSDPVTVNEAILDLFEFLAKRIDRRSLQSALICATCLETINEAVNFKISHLEKQNSNSLEGARQETNEECVSICYVCKDTTQPNSAMPLFNSCYENISYMIPKKEIDNLINPQICDRCYKSLLNFQNITSFLSIYDVAKTANDQLKSETVMDEEEFKIDIVDNCLPVDSILKVGMSKELKQEIKEEIEESDENFHKKQDELDWMDCKEEPSSGGSLDVKDKERSSTLQCPENVTADLNETNWTASRINTEMYYKESTILNKEKVYKNRTMLLHKDTDKVELLNKCQYCQYQTKFKGNLKRHMLIHKGTNEVELFKCQNCQFQTKRKSGLKSHMLLHKDTNEVELFKCQNCQFQTIRKGHLKRHMLIHKGTNEVELFKCQNCQFQTKHKGDLKRHMLLHKGTHEVKLFKCQNCQYQARRKDHLKRHMLIHKNK